MFTIVVRISGFIDKMCLVPLFFREQRISCGKCPECLRAQRGDWIYRCEREISDHKHNYFITLTFNDDHLPPTEQGVWDAFTAFRKALWKSIGKFPYFCSLERGELHDRMHLHVLLYSDVPVSKDLIRRCWRRGFITRSLISPKRIRYACSYMFSMDMFNKIRLYRASNGFGGVPSLPYRVRTVRGRPTFVPLPRYYCKKFPACGSFAKQYYANLFRKEEDFDSVYLRCSERYNSLRFGYGKKVNRITYLEFLGKFIEARARLYPTFSDPRDLIAFPGGPSHVLGLNRSYLQLLRRVMPLMAHNGDRRWGNLSRYLTIDCPLSLRSRRQKIAKEPPGLKKYVYRLNFLKKQLTFFWI